MSAPIIVSGSMAASNDYILVTFDQGVYTNLSHNLPISSGDFTCVLGGSSVNADSVALGVFYKSDGSAMSPTGGESVVRMSLTWVGTPTGNETITITVASGAAVYNSSGQAMAAGQTTGAVSTNSLLTIYVAKTGLDSNDGLTALTPKLTLGGAKSILQYGYNKIWVGVGEYTETTAWDTNYKVVSLYGDYNGAVFGGGSGSCIQTNSTDFTNSWVIEYNHMVLKHSAANKLFLFNPVSIGTFLKNAITYMPDITLESCILRASSGGSYFTNNSTWANIKILNCTVDTGNILRMCNAVFQNSIIIDNLDTKTAGKYINFSYNDASTFSTLSINNSNIIWSGNILFPNSYQTLTITNSTLQMSDTSSYLIGNAVTTSYIYNTSKCIIKDSTIKDSTGSNININTSSYITTSAIGIKNVRNNIYNYALATSGCLVLDNINSNGKRVLCYCGTIIDGDTETYQSKNVLYHYGNANSVATTYSLHCIPLKGLTVSTAYDINFYYKKMVNSTDSVNDFRIAVIEGKKLVQTMFTLISQSETYADYLATDHTYDTWYNKTLTFTTSANLYDDYFLIFRQNNQPYQFKITLPEITIH